MSGTNSPVASAISPHDVSARGMLLLAAGPAEVEARLKDADLRTTFARTLEQLAARVVSAFERVVTAGGTTVVVCHRKPIMTVLAHLLRMPHETIWRLAAVDAPGAAAYAQTLSGRVQNYAFSQLASHWTATDPHAAVAWAAQLRLCARFSNRATSAPFRR